MRALGKYVPINLVRQLYESNREPQLGGELRRDLDDVHGHRGLHQPGRAPRARRAGQALGRYLEAMTRAVASTDGTVDKFIGDAVMAFWNAPTRSPDHAARACHAVLACIAGHAHAVLLGSVGGPSTALHALRASHRARDGRPFRCSREALLHGSRGRREPCGSARAPVQAVRRRRPRQRSHRRTGGGDLAFRLIDRVAVKGRTQGVKVYELLGNRRECAEASQKACSYEKALEAYFARDFRSARELFAAIENDPPSRVMLARSEAMLVNPPPEDWSGVYVAISK